MDFHDRARNALEREDPVRALVVIVQGLRRYPERNDALDFFLFIYTRHIDRLGMETDLFRALEFQSERATLLRFTLDELERLEKREMAQAVEKMAFEQDIPVAPAVVQQLVEDGGRDEVPVDEYDKTAEQDEASLKVAGGLINEPDLPEVLKEAALESADSSKKGVSDLELDENVTVEKSTAHGDDALTDERKPRRARRPKKRWIFTFAVAISLAVTLGSVVAVSWNHAREASRVAELDEIMSVFDPLAPERAHRPLDRLSSSPATRADPAIAERRQFITALLALEGRRESDILVVQDDPQTSWGMAAAALDATRRENWEEAMRFSHHLDHAYGDSLPAFFVRGRICEARRDWECALARYSRVQQHFSEFIPARTGALRIAAYRFDHAPWLREQERLREHSPDHPYGLLSWVDPFTSVIELADRSRQREEPGEPPPGDHFLFAWHGLVRATQQVQEYQWEEAAAICREVREEVPTSLPVSNISCAVASAGRLKAGDVRDFFSAASDDAHLSRSFERQIQILAPRLLTDLGRADWAVPFAIPFDDRPREPGDADPSSDFIANREARRPAHFSPAREPLDTLDAEALLVRARTILALGATGQSRRSLDRVVTVEGFAELARFERVQTYLVGGNRRAAERAIDQIQDPVMKGAAMAHLAYLEGRHGDALQHVWSPGQDPRALRVRALAFLADRRAREAMATLQEAEEDLKYLSLLSLKQRVRARSGEEESQEEAPVFTDLSELHTIDHLIDLGGAAFWRRELNSCAELLERVLQAAPDHPEANWKVGLLRRVEGKERESRFHFQRAWRGDEDSTYLLIELGRVHLDYGRYDRAREVFLRATLRDRRNMEAIAGLGLSYHLGNRHRGRRDLVEVLGKYADTPRNAPARSEINRWLAIVNGSREGESGALIYLERASAGIGERADLLIEEGRYYLAREEWEMAQSSFARALQRNPTLPETHMGLADVARATDDQDAARQHLERVLSLVSVGEISDEARQKLTQMEDRSP